jgi:hypothetical protein
MPKGTRYVGELQIWPSGWTPTYQAVSCVGTSCVRNSSSKTRFFIGAGPGVVLARTVWTPAAIDSVQGQHSTRTCEGISKSVGFFVRLLGKCVLMALAQLRYTVVVSTHQFVDHTVPLQLSVAGIA